MTQLATAVQTESFTGNQTAGFSPTVQDGGENKKKEDYEIAAVCFAAMIRGVLKLPAGTSPKTIYNEVFIVRSKRLAQATHEGFTVRINGVDYFLYSIETGYEYSMMYLTVDGEKIYHVELPTGDLLVH